MVAGGKTRPGASGLDRAVSSSISYDSGPACARTSISSAAPRPGTAGRKVPLHRKRLHIHNVHRSGMPYRCLFSALLMRSRILAYVYTD